MLRHDAKIDSGPVYDDDILERELKQSMKVEGREDIELFKQVTAGIRLREELAGSEVAKIALRDMWEKVANFFDMLSTAPTIAGLSVNDALVVAHSDMQANFRVVAAINEALKVSLDAEQQVCAMDDMSKPVEETQ